MSFEVLPPEPEKVDPNADDPRRKRWHELFERVRTEGRGNWCQIESYDTYNKAVWTAHRLRRYASTLVPPGMWDIRARNLNDDNGDFERSSLQVRYIKQAVTPQLLASPKGRKPTVQRHTVERAEPAAPDELEQPSGRQVSQSDQDSLRWSGPADPITDLENTPVQEWVLNAVDDLEMMLGDMGAAERQVWEMMQDAPTELEEELTAPE